MKEHVHVHEDPDAGQETLEIFSHTNRFNSWMFENLAPFCRGHVLEIGSGIGNMSALLLSTFETVSLSDIRADYCDILRERFADERRLAAVYQLDLGEPELEKRHPDLLGRFDSILTSNVVEHIKDDSLAISNCRKLLRPGGRLVVLVPAYGALYNSFDELLGHYRRYTRKSLSDLLQKEAFVILDTHYFNAAGIAGWWFSGVVLGKKKLPAGQLALYNQLVPLLRLGDILTMRRIGLSIIATGEKK